MSMNMAFCSLFIFNVCLFILINIIIKDNGKNIDSIFKEFSKTIVSLSEKSKEYNNISEMQAIDNKAKELDKKFINIKPKDNKGKELKEEDIILWRPIKIALKR